MRCRNAMKSLSVLGLVFALLTLSGCVLATVRTLDEDEEAKVGFEPEVYVEEIWESRVLPAYDQEAVDLTMLLSAIEADEDAAIAEYGNRSGTGAYSFMVRGEGTIITLDTSSRAGLLVVDLAPADGTADLNIAVGPLIKISQRGSVRDAVGFIEYGNFVNQQEFAGVANAMGERITAMVADALGADSAEAIGDLDPAAFKGKSVTFVGAFSLDTRDDIIIVPVDLEVSD